MQENQSQLLLQWLVSGFQQTAQVLPRCTFWEVTDLQPHQEDKRKCFGVPSRQKAFIYV